jgi:uncharacterized membrane protein YesL
MKVTLLKKLTVAKDRREFEPPKPNVGRIRLFFAQYKMNTSSFFMVNILFLIFVIPLIFVFVYIKPKLQAGVLDSYNFIGNLGIGYPGNIDSIIQAKLELYNIYYQLILYAAASFVFIGIGAAGLFYCSRNYAWFVKVKPFKDFFKDIKKYILPYLIVFIFYGLILLGSGTVVIWHLRLNAQGIATFWSWLCVILVSFIDLLIIMISIHLLPMFTAYKFKFFDNIKNSLILTISLFPVALIIAVLILIPVLLSFTTPYVKILFIILFLFFGFSFYSFMWTSYAHYSYEMTIKTLYLNETSVYDKKDKVIQMNNQNKKPVNNQRNLRKEYKQKSKEKNSK